ncbi:MAG: hypothetical protein KDA52_06780 [Planctomycetaceae bacterium]|nr:hypothetical protein [Planctomycetaceae bacterium]
MSLFAMDMPETHAELVEWLEQHLVGLNLASLVAELSAIHGEADDSSSLKDLLGSRMPDVMENGLTVLDTKQVRSLVCHPRYLLELQELVLSTGGQHWHKRMTDTADNEFDRIAETGWKRVQLAIAPSAEKFESDALSKKGAQETVTGDSATQVSVPTVRIAHSVQKSHPQVTTRSPWRIILASAAMLMLGVLGLQQAGVLNLPLNQGAPVAVNQEAPPPAAPTGWGWDKPGAIPEDGPADVYLTQLATAADDWFKKRPEDGDGVKKRITQFRDGCSTLISSSHKPLSAEDREWLVEKCKAWRGKLDEQIAALDAGTDPLTARAATDEIVNKLMTALRTRAEELA